MGNAITVGAATAGADAACGYITYGTAAYRRAGWALFLAGFASFSLIYCVQPLLPEFTKTFLLTPAQSSLALSYSTGFLAITIMLAGAFSQAIGRKGLMFTSMALGALLNMVASLASDWHLLLLARAFEGIVLGGVPAVAIAWLAEEIHPKDLGKAMGSYIAGTAFGGMMGRVLMGLLTEYMSWRTALGSLGFICLLSAIGFFLLLPPSRHFVLQRSTRLHTHLTIWARHLRNRRLIGVYISGFLLTSIFVTLFNYATFRLSAAPYSLSQTQISLIFLVFGFGMLSSSVGGRLADRFGKRPLLIASFFLMAMGVALTLFHALWLVLAGIMFITTGFFSGHSVASASVGGLAEGSKGHASSLYLLFYYMGSSIVGAGGGWFWQHGGWLAIVGLTGALALVGTALNTVAMRPA